MKPLPDSASPEAVTGVVPAREGGARHAVPAADAVALSLVFLLVFCVVCFVWGAAILGRRERHVAAEDPDRTGSDQDPAPHAGQGEAKESPAPWEREADWWKH